MAQYKARDMTDETIFLTLQPWQSFNMMKSFGIDTVLQEKILQRTRTPQQVMNSWMNSSGHRANILNSNFTQIGVGYDPRSNSWVQMFISP